MDYEALLRKYIAHVRESEGADYIEQGRLGYDLSDVAFTHEEWAALERLASEPDKVPRDSGSPVARAEAWQASASRD